MFERFFCCQHNAPSYLKVFTRRSVNAVKKLSFWNGRITYHQLDFKTGWTKPEVGWGKRGLIPKAQFCLLYLFLRLFHLDFTGVTNDHGPSSSQQHSGRQHAVFWLYQEVTRPKARFKPTSPEKSGVDGGANQVPTYLLYVCFSLFWVYYMFRLTIKPLLLTE